MGISARDSRRTSLNSGHRGPLARVPPETYAHTHLNERWNRPT